jgi:hypothetical protein
MQKRILMLATPLMIVCGLLASGVSARADSHDGPCSNRTLRGDYGFAIEGLLLPAPGVTIPVRGVAMTHFDGKGNLTQVDHVVVDGMPPAADWTFGSGPYAVNSDCTGTATINVPGNPFSPVKLHLVVVKEGKEIHTVVDAGAAVTSVGIRRD